MIIMHYLHFFLPHRAADEIQSRFVSKNENKEDSFVARRTFLTIQRHYSCLHCVAESYALSSQHNAARQAYTHSESFL